MSDAPREEWFEIDVELDEQPSEETRLHKLVDRVTEACPVPASSQLVLELTRVPDNPIKPIVDAVAKDPALAAELMRIANSPVFGQTRKIQSLQRAVVVVGMQELHSMAAAMSMLAAFTSNEELMLELRGSSVLSATIARFAIQKGGGADLSSAFLCGLLCEIGAMACLSVDSDGYNALWNKSKTDINERSRLEKRRYGAASPHIGAHMLARNQLPQAVVDAVEASSPGADVERTMLAKVTAFSRLAAPMLIEAARAEHPDESDIPVEIGQIAESLQLTEIKGDDLWRICVEAATIAELGLRGEVALLEDEEATAAETAADPPEQSPEDKESAKGVTGLFKRIFK